MDDQSKKQVKIIKRSEREVLTLATLPSSELRTAAQVQRDIVSIITSWIDEKKRTRNLPIR